MVDVSGKIFCIGLVIAFFYFGYINDYNRGPKEFKSSIIGVLIHMFSFMNEIPFVSGFVKKWNDRNEDR